MVGKVKHTVKKHMKPVGYGRWFRSLMAVVFLASLAIPALITLSNTRAYALSDAEKKVIGASSSNLSTKFSFDEGRNLWQFNKDGTSALAAKLAVTQGDKDDEGLAGALGQMMAKQVGGSGKKDSSLYSVDLPVKGKNAITYYDNVTKLKFSMTPQFSKRDAKLVEGRIVYPFMDGGKIVYTAKNNGLKEDLVLSKYVGDTLSYSYNLTLPESLEARLLKDGSIGVYSADPSLFGDISYGSDSDKAKIAEARKSAPKNNLVFGIPSPYIKDQTGRVGHTYYKLDGTKLTVVAENLKGLSYPLTVDPSVMITSSTDYTAGNNEGNIAFGTDEISRGGLTGGALSVGWVNAGGVFPGTNAFSTSQTAVVNGRIYVLINSYLVGQTDNRGLWYATASGGTLSNWTKTAAAVPTINNHMSLAAYNGYLYTFGGSSGSGASAALEQNERYAKPAADGSVAEWTVLQASSPWGPRAEPTVVAYNGYMYLHGGCTLVVTAGLSRACGATSHGTDTWRAAINANGTLGTWSQQNGATPSAGMTSNRGAYNMVAYNNYLYIAGGCIYSTSGFSATNCDSYTTDVSMAKINDDGTIGGWQAQSLLNTARGCVNLDVYNGYLYIVGGSTGQNCTRGTGASPEYAAVHSDGSVSQWRTTSVTSSATSPTRAYHASFAYKGYIYLAGGCQSDGTNCPSTTTESISAKIDEAGSIGPYAATTDVDTAANSERSGMATIATHGYIYVLGGNLSTGFGVNPTNTVRSAPINANGTLGTWSNNTPFTDERIRASAVVSGNSIYLVGGVKTNGEGTQGCKQIEGSHYCQEVIRATINPSNGVLTWSGSYTYSTQGRSDAGAVINNGYLYVMGGRHQNNSIASSEVNYAKVNADGTLGSFATTTSLLMARSNTVGAVAWGGHIYAIGGYNGQATSEYATPLPDGTIPSSGAGSWTYTGGNLPFAQTFSQTVVYNGYIYNTGGSSINNGNGSTYTQSIKINSDGTLGTWSVSSQNFTQLRYQHGSAVYNGYLYVLGGCTNSISCNSANARKDVQYARITNGGDGTTGTWGAAGLNSSHGTNRHQTASATYQNRFVYVTGGCTGAALVTCAGTTGDIQYAAINTTTHAVGPFNSLSASIPARYGHAAAVYDNYLYIVGGCNSGGNFCNGMTRDIYYGAINPATGNVASFTLSSTSVPVSAGTGIYKHTAVAYNGHLYVIGGCTTTLSSFYCGNYENTVRYAAINSDGSVSSTWSTSNFNTGRYDHTSLVYGDKLYVVGGCTAGNTTHTCTGFNSDIQYASINSNGSIDTWRVGGTTQTGRMGSAMVAQNGYLYLIGGCSSINTQVCTSINPNVELAPIAPSGTIGNWSISPNAYPVARHWHTAYTAGGYVYITSGLDGGGNFRSDTQAAHLNSQARIGRYSTLVQINNAVEIADVYYNGNLGAGSRLDYKVAPSSGVFSATGVGYIGSGSEPTPRCGLPTIQYVFISLVMDDSTRATFGGNESASTNTDITIYYRLTATPPPNLRLTGGKWFYNETQQSLDICKV